MPAGRPTKYREEYCDLARELGRQGKSRTAIAAEIGVTRDTMYRWAEEHKEFSNAIEEAYQMALRYWENVLGETASGERKGNPAALQFLMKNQFRRDYLDSQEHHHTGDVQPREIKITVVGGDDD